MIVFILIEIIFLIVMIPVFPGTLIFIPIIAVISGLLVAFIVKSILRLWKRTK
jgi:hypothetical protein